MNKIGDNVGGYTLLEHLGAGGSGDVFKASDEGGDLFALKLFTTSDDYEIRERVKREVNILRSANHPNVVSVEDFELDSEICFLVYELLTGPNL
ncbi:MAG: protein kinase, partial [Bifidobacteriaceae bacterium]|nr:protein kinase [Bifidobacteriaceae bacterium]